MICNLKSMSNTSDAFFVEFRLEYLKNNSFTTFYCCIRNSEDCKSSKSLFFDSQMRKLKPSSFILCQLQVRLSRLWFLKCGQKNVDLLLSFVATQNYPANQIKS